MSLHLVSDSKRSRTYPQSNATSGAGALSNYESYEEFFRARLPSLKRDIFSGDHSFERLALGNHSIRNSECCVRTRKTPMA
jgi:hypothetical protein